MEVFFETLKHGLYVCRSEWHTFGTDAFLLTGFSKYRSKDRVCDLGTGCGIIPLLMQRSGAPKEIYAVDIQPEAIAQLQMAMDRAEQPLSIHPICADLCTLWDEAPLYQLDLVTCNPPYKSSETGILSQLPAHQIARHEVACDISDICHAAARLLRYHGRFCLCCRPERLTDVMCAMRAAKIEPKRLRLVCKDPDSQPWLFLLEGKKDAKPFLQIEPTLFVRSGEGMTSEAAQICHFGEEYL
ncbi:MAG: methyltransferase [Oscillospiraceae bacterium]|nr:methyltransferase [Oscillospiraceae bacterium]